MKNSTLEPVSFTQPAAAEREYKVTFRCFYEEGAFTRYVRDLPLGDLQKWIESYEWTHPNCTSISFGVWLQDNTPVEPARTSGQNIQAAWPRPDEQAEHPSRMARLCQWIRGLCESVRAYLVSIQRKKEVLS